ncbi:hypothetical protein EsH8_IV_000032 [Colletotrichum jinshuiense]
MAPQQNTFSVISAGPGRAGGAPSRPPMTSKQAQKLYKQATKEPRRSKAEQRKWEKERQEEIRKELEKERAAAKARMARERKKAKEDEARENRRRAGEPLFNCRPSQDTIARFVRGNGTNKKRDSSGEPTPEAEEASVASSETKPPPPPALASKPNPHALANHVATPTCEKAHVVDSAPANHITASSAPSGQWDAAAAASTSPEMQSFYTCDFFASGFETAGFRASPAAGGNLYGASAQACSKVETQTVHDASGGSCSSAASSAQDVQAYCSYCTVCTFITRGATAAEPNAAEPNAAETTVAETTVAETTVAETTVAETTVAETAIRDARAAETTVAETAIRDTGATDASAQYTSHRARLF